MNTCGSLNCRSNFCFMVEAVANTEEAEVTCKIFASPLFS